MSDGKTGMVSETWKNQETEVNRRCQDWSCWTKHLLSPVTPAALWKTSVTSVFCSSLCIQHTNRAFKPAWFVFEDQPCFRPQRWLKEGSVKILGVLHWQLLFPLENWPLAEKMRFYLFIFIFIVSQSPAMKEDDGNYDTAGKKMVLQIFFFLR